MKLFKIRDYANAVKPTEWRLEAETLEEAKEITLEDVGTLENIVIDEITIEDYVFPEDIFVKGGDKK